MKIRTIGATAALALALAGCGGSGDDEKASKNLADSIMDSNSATFEVTQEQADCVGEGFVDEIGTDQLVEYKILNEDLEAADGLDAVKMSEGDAQSAADVMQGCADIKEILTGAMGGELPAEAKTCIDEKLTDDVLNEFLVAVFTDDQEAGTEGLTTALTECITAGG